MEDKQAQKKEFVREKIKDKPRNKKRLLLRVLYAALCGIAFAVAASIVFALVLPKIIKNSNASLTPAKETETAATQQTDTENGTEADTETETAAEMETETEDTGQPPQTAEQPPEGVTEPPVEFQLTIEDYQDIQNQLYAIGTDVNRSIVTITSVVNDTDIFNNPYEMEGQGSGVIIAENESELLILTEKKVIHGAKRLSATFIDDSVCEVQLKKQDGNTGLAILAAQKADLAKPTKDAIAIATIGNSFRVKSGAMVIALGSPLGTNYSILTGNITSTENEITTEDHNYSLFTTDIIGSKDGSGILINVQGEIVGIVMQSYSTKNANNTLTAVAISELAPVIGMLCEGKAIPYLGLHVSTVTDKVANAYQMPKGVYIREVTLDSPAMNAGLQSGDVIIEMNDEKVLLANSYSAKLLACEPSQNIKLVVCRKGANGYSEFTYTVEAGILKQ